MPRAEQASLLARGTRCVRWTAPSPGDLHADRADIPIRGQISIDVASHRCRPGALQRLPEALWRAERLRLALLPREVPWVRSFASEHCQEDACGYDEEENEQVAPAAVTTKLVVESLFVKRLLHRFAE